MEKIGTYASHSAVFEHTLLVADLFVRLMQLQMSGDISLIRCEPEWRRGEIICDLYVDVNIHAIKKHRRYYVEVQRNARSTVIPKKLKAYAKAYDGYDGLRDGVWPYLVFLVYDAVHARAIRRQVPADMRQWVRVQTADEFMGALTAA